MSPYEACPRFKDCSVNVCPLDPEQGKRVQLPGEPRCGLAKAVRVRVAERFPGVLPRGGLTAGEHAAALRWARVPEAQRRAMSEAGKARLRAWRTKNEARAAGGGSVSNVIDLGEEGAL